MLDGRRLLRLRQIKLVDPESETDEGDRSPDTSHEGTFLRHKRAAKGQIHAGSHNRSIGTGVRYSASGQLRVLKTKFTGCFSPNAPCIRILSWEENA